MLFVLCAVGGIFAVLAVGLAALVFSFNNSLQDAFREKHLEPIPVAATACPYLRQIHDEADAAGRVYRQLWLAPATGQGWRRDQAQEAQQLAAFQLTLLAAVPHVPPPVARQLQILIADVAAGRKKVAVARSGSDYVTSSIQQVGNGLAALGNANDLVGNACGFTLSPPLPGIGPST